MHVCVYVCVRFMDLVGTVPFLWQRVGIQDAHILLQQREMVQVAEDRTETLTQLSYTNYSTSFHQFYHSCRTGAGVVGGVGLELEGVRVWGVSGGDWSRSQQ